MPWNPLDWPAAPVIVLYLLCAAVLFSTTFYLKSHIEPGAVADKGLNLLELACLAGGGNRLGDAILLALLASGGAAVTPDGRKISVHDTSALHAYGIDVPHLVTRGEMSRKTFQKAIEPIIDRVEADLCQSHYLASHHAIRSRLLFVLPFQLALLGLGVSKIAVGMQRQHSTDILVVLSIVTFVAGLCLTRLSWRTRAGKQALQRYLRSHERAARAPLDHELAIALALSGAIVLTGTEFGAVYAASRRVNGDDAASSCGGGGCGGGGCGGCS